MGNGFFDKLDGMTLLRRFNHIAFDCEGRPCSACPWRDDKKGRCVKRDTMREVRMLLDEANKTKG